MRGDYVCSWMRFKCYHMRWRWRIPVPLDKLSHLSLLGRWKLGGGENTCAFGRTFTPVITGGGGGGEEYLYSWTLFNTCHCWVTYDTFTPLIAGRVGGRDPCR